MSLAQALAVAAIEAGAELAKGLLSGKGDDELLADARAIIASYRNAERLADAAAKAKYPRLR